MNAKTILKAYTQSRKWMSLLREKHGLRGISVDEDSTARLWRRRRRQSEKFERRLFQILSDYEQLRGISGELLGVCEIVERIEAQSICFRLDYSGLEDCEFDRVINEAREIIGGK